MPRFQPGQSGNPRGRPPGGTALAERVRARCSSDGAAYVDLLHAIAMDATEPTRVRLEAIKMLFDRGFGRPPQEVVVSRGDLGDVDDQTLARMSDAQLSRFLQLTSEARALIGV